MTCVRVEVTVERLTKTKMAQKFCDVFAPFFSCKAEMTAGDDIDGALFVLDGEHSEIEVDMRVVVGNDVFNIYEIMGNVLKCKRDQFESQLKAIINSGGYVECGVVQSNYKDTNSERFMDCWVGTYIKNIVAHYDEIRNGRDISALYGIFNHDIPVACVGAGPSLDKNVEFLRDFPGLIIVADKAYKMLVARGIDPDLVISVDCHYDLIADMLDCPGSDKHTLILNTCSDPKICKVWKGKIFWYVMKHPGVQFTDYILPELFPKFHGIENAGNVGNSSVLFADYAGFAPIVLVGQDYGYTGGKMHATRFTFEGGKAVPVSDDHADLFEKRTGKVEVNGVVTYLPFADYMATLVDLHKKRGLNIINCTEGGIVKGLPEKPLKEMCEELRALNAEKHLEARRKIKTI